MEDQEIWRYSLWVKSGNENKYKEYLISIRVQNVINDLHKKDLE